MAVQYPNTDPIVPYISPTNTRVFVGKWQLDDVCGISYSMEASRTPLFGFKSSTFDGIGWGSSIVSGSILCQFRYPGYLTKVIQELASQDYDQSDAGSKNGAGDLTAKMASQDPIAITAALSEALAKGDTKTYTALKSSLTKLFQPSVKVVDYLPTAAAVQKQFLRSIDLKVVYNRVDQKDIVMSSEDIKGVYFTGQNKQISMLDGAGDSCIVEVYPFIAREVLGNIQQ